MIKGLNNMDFSTYDKKELMVAAIKSEIDSNCIYTKLASYVKNGLMKDKFTFLADEEKKHQQFLEGLYEQEFPNTKRIIPSVSPVPLPEVTIPNDENIEISTVLKQAMDAEQAAAEFYMFLATQFEDKNIQHMLHYFSDMEQGHYQLLEQEKKSMEWFEQADVYWPMIHAGP